MFNGNIKKLFIQSWLWNSFKKFLKSLLISFCSFLDEYNNCLLELSFIKVTLNAQKRLSEMLHLPEKLHHWLSVSLIKLILSTDFLFMFPIFLQRAPLDGWFWMLQCNSFMFNHKFATGQKTATIVSVDWCYKISFFLLL